MKNRILKNFRMIKLVGCDLSDIMDFFMKQQKLNSNLFVFFHMDVPMEDHETLFKEYIETMTAMLNTYCKGAFSISNVSFESYLNEIQIRYRVTYQQ